MIRVPRQARRSPELHKQHFFDTFSILAMRPQPDFACKCLNVRIYVSQSPKDDPPTSQDDGFEWIYVQPDGISIVCSIF